MKKAHAVISALLVTAVIAACIAGFAVAADQEVLSAREFRVVMEENGYEVTDGTDAAKYSNCLQRYGAVNKQKSSFEYYCMGNEAAAWAVYQDTVDNLSRQYSQRRTALITERKCSENAAFQVCAPEYHCEVVRKGNTVLLLTAASGHEQEIQPVMDRLGY